MIFAYCCRPKSNGQIRIYVDLRQLNREVNRERYKLPTLDDAASKLSGAIVFAHLDLTSGYYHLMLHPDCARLTTFITPFTSNAFRLVLRQPARSFNEE